MAVAVGGVIVSLGLIVGGIVEATFIQKMDSETVICSLEMPIGESSENLREQMQRLTDFIVEPGVP